MKEIKLDVGEKINVDGETYTVVEGSVHDELGDSYIISDENNLLYNLEFQKDRMILSKAKGKEGSWKFSDHKIIKEFLRR